MSDWLNHIDPGIMADDHIMMGAYSEMDFPLQTILVPPKGIYLMMSVAA